MEKRFVESFTDSSAQFVTMNIEILHHSACDALFAWCGNLVNTNCFPGVQMADINDLLMSACPAGSEIHSGMLDDPPGLHGHLEASMDLPAQTLAKALPNRLTAWLKTEPPPKHPERPDWVQYGRFLLDQARLSGSDME